MCIMLEQYQNNSVARTDKKVTTITKAGEGETSEEDSFLDDDQSLDDYFRT